MITFGRDVLKNYERAVEKEFLFTNSLNCYSSSTIIGANTRKYHGLLVFNHRLYLAKLEEEIAGAKLGVNRYAKEVIYPRGYQFLERFELYPSPTFTYIVKNIIIKKTIVLSQNSPTLLVNYEIITPEENFFKVYPLITERSAHETRYSFNFEQKSSENGVKVGKLIIESNINFQELRDVYYNFIYEKDRERGYSYLDNLYSPGFFIAKLKKGKNIIRIITHFGNPEITNQDFVRPKNFLECLELTAESFLVKDNIIAGYHWFTFWGRDTFISLPGLLLTRKKFEQARKILLLYASRIKNGLIPNRLLERDYHSADASLWFLYAVKKYFDYTKDYELIKKIALHAREIFESYVNGINGIEVCKDGLVRVARCQTWMDTKYTPREGKPVEINALWFNALSILEELFGIECKKLKDEVRKNFSKFWNEKENCLFDVVEPNDPSIRPNQIFAISLPYRILPIDKEKKIIEKVENELLTPYGLRTLSPKDKRYKGTFTGDEAYHNGCVWPWLLGQFITAFIKVDNDREYCRELIKPLLEHLKDAGLGSISEIFDGDVPYKPRGCISQAWSVAEMLRCMHEDLK